MKCAEKVNAGYFTTLRVIKPDFSLKSYQRNTSAYFVLFWADTFVFENFGLIIFFENNSMCTTNGLKTATFSIILITNIDMGFQYLKIHIIIIIISEDGFEIY